MSEGTTHRLQPKKARTGSKRPIEDKQKVWTDVWTDTELSKIETTCYNASDKHCQYVSPHLMAGAFITSCIVSTTSMWRDAGSLLDVCADTFRGETWRRRWPTPTTRPGLSWPPTERSRFTHLTKLILKDRIFLAQTQHKAKLLSIQFKDQESWCDENVWNGGRDQ